MATSVGSNAVAPVVDSLVGMALRTRGADVTMVLCDGALPACEASAYVEFSNVEEFIDHGPQSRLRTSCFGAGSSYYAPLPLPLRRYSELVARDVEREAMRSATDLDLEGCFSFEVDGLRLGEQARAACSASSARRISPRSRTTRSSGQHDATRPQHSSPHKSPSGRSLPRARCARRTSRCLRSTGRARRGRSPRRGRPLGTVVSGPTAIYSHGDTYHRTFLTEPADHWNRALDDSQENALLAYPRQPSARHAATGPG